MSSRFVYNRLHPSSFWKNIPVYSNVSESDFFNHNWQQRNILDAKKIVQLPTTCSRFWSDFQESQAKSTMSVKVTPYIASLIDWNDPYNCPVRKQFVPTQSTSEPDHPMLKLDSLNEQLDSPVPGLVHRYADKVLFLTTSTCPVYCRFCTRSYSIGTNTESVNKVKFIPGKSRFEKIYKYIEENPTIEDVVVSGGDTFMLPGHVLLELGKRLLSIDHVRRIRCATKGLSAMPMKILTDNEWFESVAKLNQLARDQLKSFAIHTHINHPNEITYVTREAANRLFKANIHVRNQSVLLRGINDNFQTMHELIKYLSYMNIQPYYVYLHDMVAGAEEFRTTLASAVELEKELRGLTAGFNMPQFVVDLPAGGGKRLISSFEIYNRDMGISIFRSPSVEKRRNIHRTEHKTDLFCYFDPLRSVANKYRHSNMEQFTRLVTDVCSQLENDTQSTFASRHANHAH